MSKPEQTYNQTIEEIFKTTDNNFGALYDAGLVIERSETQEIDRYTKSGFLELPSRMYSSELGVLGLTSTVHLHYIIGNEGSVPTETTGFEAYLFQASVQPDDDTSYPEYLILHNQNPQDEGASSYSGVKNELASPYTLIRMQEIQESDAPLMTMEEAVALQSLVKFMPALRAQID